MHAYFLLSDFKLDHFVWLLVVHHLVDLQAIIEMSLAVFEWDPAYVNEMCFSL